MTINLRKHDHTDDELVSVRDYSLIFNVIRGAFFTLAILVAAMLVIAALNNIEREYVFLFNQGIITDMNACIHFKEKDLYDNLLMMASYLPTDHSIIYDDDDH